MAEIFGFDSYLPKEIAERVETTGVVKARLPVLTLAVLGLLAGGVTFSLGLILVVVAGAEHLTWWGLLSSLAPVTLGNIVGGGLFVAPVYHFVYRRPSLRAEAARPQVSSASARRKTGSEN